MVCLSVVCHFCASCLNRSSDLDKSFGVHICGDILRWMEVHNSHGKRGFEGRISPSQNMLLQIADCRWVNRNEGQFCLLPDYFGAYYLCHRRSLCDSICLFVCLSKNVMNELSIN